MESGFYYSILFSTIIAGLGFLSPQVLGPTILRKQKKSKNFLNIILGFPAGAFLANAVINLIPEVF